MTTRTAHSALRSLGPLAGLLAVWVFFALLAGPNFRAWDNHRLMLLQTAVVAVATLVAINSAYAMIVDHNYRVARHLR